MCGAFLGSSGGRGAGRYLVVTVGTMLLGFIRRTTISSYVVPLFPKVDTYIHSIRVVPTLGGLSPHANYTDRAAAAGRRS